MSKFTQLVDAYKGDVQSLDRLLIEVDRLLAGQDRDSITSIAKELGNFSLPPHVITSIKNQLILSDNDTTVRVPTDSASHSLPLPNGNYRSRREGETLNRRFELIKRVGSGGMSTVYKALDRLKLTLDDQDPYVAVKVLNRRFSMDPRGLSILQQEAANCRHLVHRNIVTVYELFQDGPMVYIVMEYLDGQPLTRMIRSSDFNGLSAEQALTIINAMGDALAFAHDKGIVHCDFKPANIFLTRGGEVKLIDFGTARVFSRGGTPTERCVESQSFLAMTPVYASPDIIEGHVPDPRDDVFSLACTAYELLTGTHPFNHLWSIEACRVGLAVERRPPLTQHQWRTLKQALAFDRALRTPSVRRFLRELNTEVWSTVQVSIASGIAAWALAMTLTMATEHMDQSSLVADQREDRLVTSMQTATTDNP